MFTINRSILNISKTTLISLNTIKKISNQLPIENSLFF